MIDNKMLRELAIQLEAAHYGERLTILQKWLNSNGIPPPGPVMNVGDEYTRQSPPADVSTIFTAAASVAEQVDDDWIHSQMKPNADAICLCNNRTRKYYWQIAWDVLSIFYCLAVSIMVIGLVVGWWRVVLL